MANIVRRGGRQEMTPQQQGGWDPWRIMREMLTWDPFREMSGAGVPSLGGLLEGRQGMVGFVPTFEVKETKDAYIFKADLPGVKQDDLEISLTGNRLTINGKREYEERNEGETYHAFERAFGTFTRSFTLPEGADVDNVRADLKDGVLALVLPKKPEVQPKKIEIGTGGTPTTGGKTPSKA